MYNRDFLHVKERVDALTVRDVRYIFSLLRRTQHADVDHFFPKYGFTCGDFAICYVLNMCKKHNGA
jgi:hypothetical protein